MAWETKQLLRCSRGRAFVLFTSYATMRAVVRLLELQLAYPVLVQGTAPRSVLLEEFRRTPHAVLFATSSFWQGVDVQGEQLSAVIIDKLPFVSPGDPVVAARIEALSAQGISAFEQDQVPLAILALMQGLGRPIRHRATAACWRCSIRGSGRWATGGASSTRCRRPRSPTRSTTCDGSSS